MNKRGTAPAGRVEGWDLKMLLTTGERRITKMGRTYRSIPNILASSDRFIDRH
jgi:hypothetical protein